MKRKYLNLVVALLLILGSSITFLACSGTPEIPSNEPENKHHDDPYKAVLTLASGHFHGVMFHQDAEIEGLKYMNAIQTITFEYTEGKGWAPAKGSTDKFVVLAGSDKVQAAYGLWIQYYNKKGEEITGQFVQNGEDKIHQHFFIPSDVKPLPKEGVAEADDNDPTKLVQYTYMDTTPWNKTLRDDGTKLTGKENPIGFKGWFQFYKTRKTLSLIIRLMHARISKYKNGQTSPFYAPTSAQLLSDSWDVEIKVPVCIAHSRVEEDDTQIGENSKYETLNEADKRIVRAVAEAYNISNEEVLAAFKLRITGKGNNESGSRWF